MGTEKELSGLDADKSLGSQAFLLGMLRLGAQSGYAIKKAANVSTKFFWRVSFSQIYPELARLEYRGLVTKRDSPQGRRRRSIYGVTDSGKEALLDWLRSSDDAPLQLRDEGLLRLYFADALSLEEQLELVRRLRGRAAQSKIQVFEGSLPFPQQDARFPSVVAKLGADTLAYVEQWLGELEAELEELQLGSGGCSERFS